MNYDKGKVIKCLIYGISTEISFVMFVSMIITLIVIVLIEPYFNLNSAKELSIFALVSCGILFTICLYKYINACKKLQNKVKFKGLISELHQELHHIEVMDYCYMQNDDNTINEETLNIKIKSLEQLINENTSSDNNNLE